MSTFQRSGLWEGQAPDPLEAQSSRPKLQLPPEAQAPSETPWPMSLQSRAVLSGLM